MSRILRGLFGRRGKKRRLRATGKLYALCTTSEIRIIGPNMSNRMGWKEHQYRKAEKKLTNLRLENLKYRIHFEEAGADGKMV
jgi:hypothetical protein